MESKNLAIMFVDMVGFSGKTSTLTRKQVIDLLDKFSELVKINTVKLSGEVVKSLGDGYIVSFESPTNAVLCGLKIQAEIKDNKQLKSRIAINSGEVTFKDGDIFGEPINIAARLEATAEPGEVYFTEAVYLAMNKHEAPSSEVDARLLKGIPEEIKVYKVIKDEKMAEDSRVKRIAGLLAVAGLPKDKINIIKKGSDQSTLVGTFSKGFGFGGLAAIIGIMTILLVNLNNPNVKQAVLSETFSPTPTPTPATTPSIEPSAQPTEEVTPEPTLTQTSTPTPAAEIPGKTGSGKFLGIIKNILEK